MNKNINFLIFKLNNAYRFKKSYIDIKTNKDITRILKILKEEGYIYSYIEIIDKGSKINRVYLKLPIYNLPSRINIVNNIGTFYSNNLNMLKSPFRVISIASKSSKGYYLSSKDLKKLYSNYHTNYIIATPKGLLSLKNALKEKVGGTLYLKIQL